MKRTQDGDHLVYVLGKNGERRPDVKLKVNIKHKWFYLSGKNPQINLTTDKEGKVNLGPLKKVMEVSVKCASLDCKQTWYLGKHFGGESSN
jgi:hypothetical protein